MITQVVATHGPASYGPATQGAVGIAAAKKKATCATGVPIILERLGLTVGTDRAAVGMRSYTIAVGRVKDRARGMVIRVPDDVLGDTGKETGGVNSSVNDSSTIVATSIRGSDILDSSSRIADSRDKVGRLSRGTSTSYISYLYSSIEIMWDRGVHPDLQSSILSLP